jgi:hypothetical protein
LPKIYPKKQLVMVGFSHHHFCLIRFFRKKERVGGHDRGDSMIGDEMNLKVLSQWSMLNSYRQRQAEEYLQFLLLQQIKSEFIVRVLQNKFLKRGLMALLAIPTDNEDYAEEVIARVNNLKSMFQCVFDQIYQKYEAVVNLSRLDEIITDFALDGFSYIESAAQKGCPDLIQREVKEMVETYQSLERNFEPTKRVV